MRSATDQGCAVSSAYLFHLNCLPFCFVFSLLPVRSEGWLCNTLCAVGDRGCLSRSCLCRTRLPETQGLVSARAFWSLWNHSTVEMLKHERRTQAQKMNRKPAFLYQPLVCCDFHIVCTQLSLVLNLFVVLSTKGKKPSVLFSMGFFDRGARHDRSSLNF